jgi:hypothetical protein
MTSKNQKSSDYGTLDYNKTSLDEGIKEAFIHPEEAYRKAHSQRKNDVTKEEKLKAMSIETQIRTIKQDAASQRLRKTIQERSKRRTTAISSSIKARNTGKGSKRRHKKTRKTMKKSRKQRRKSYRRRR